MQFCLFGGFPIALQHFLPQESRCEKTVSRCNVRPFMVFCNGWAPARSAGAHPIANHHTNPHTATTERVSAATFLGQETAVNQLKGENCNDLLSLSASWREHSPRSPNLGNQLRTTENTQTNSMSCKIKYFSPQAQPWWALE